MKPINSGTGTRMPLPPPAADPRTRLSTSRPISKPKPGDALERSRSTGPFTQANAPSRLTSLNHAGSVAKGLAADRILPQQYRFRPLTPGVRGGTSVAMIIDMKAGRTSAASLNPRGEWLLRFDGPDKGTPRPHLNLNRELTGFKDPHLAISSTTLKVAGGAARTLEAVGRVARPVAIATDTIRLANAVRADGGRIGAHTAVTAGSVAGGWGGAAAGAWLGAKGGALAGGLVGSFFPVVGTAAGAAVGGLVGGIVGGIAGGFAGSAAGERLAEKATT